MTLNEARTLLENNLIGLKYLESERVEATRKVLDHEKALTEQLKIARDKLAVLAGISGINYAKTIDKIDSVLADNA